LLELLGRGYVIEHCISSFKNRTEEKAYKIYVTDSLYAIANGLYQYLGKGDAMEKRFIDIIEKSAPKKEETEEEVIERIRGKLKG
jgi:hypothetical protein